MKKIYLDYAATAPMDKRVIEAMRPYFDDKFGNPGSLHSFGQEALKAVDESREKIAQAVGADFREIIFTGSATEANNLALRGVVKSFNKSRQNFLPLRIIVSSIEHESILETARDLEKEGIEIIYLPVDKSGFVDLKKLKESLNEQTILVSVMSANNEIGTIQNIPEISKIIQDFKAKKFSSSKPPQPSGHGPSFSAPQSGATTAARRGQASESLDERSGLRKENFFAAFPFFHADVVQAFQFLNCDADKLGVDLMTLSAHKIYGPKGIGALYVKNYESGIMNQEFKKSIIHNSKFLLPIITGGGQEFGLRSGTENVAAIVGFAKATELVVKNRKKETKRIGELADYFWQEIKKIYPKAEINGPSESQIPNILNIHFPGQNADDLLIKFDLAGVAISSGAACSARAMKPSYVLKAVGCPDKRIKSSLRFSFGRFTTKEEIKKTIKILKNI